jgi:FkbM family methyltransferase
MVSLSAELGAPPGYIRIADIGAAFLGNKPPYQALIDSAIGKRFLFEPDEVAFGALRRSLEAGAVLLPYALGDGARHRLHVATGGMTSLLEPDPESWAFLTPFGMPPFMPLEDAVRTIEIETRRLDEIEEIPTIDFLKIDVQGAELMVLRNGRAKLKDCAFVQIEMSFFTLYKDQPGFADVDGELRSQGFMAHGLAEMARFPIAPYCPEDPWPGLNQLVEVDMLYVRDVKHPQTLTADQLKKTALIADACYGSFDLATRCLAELERRGHCRAGTTERYAAAAFTRARRVISHDLPAWD